MRNGSSFLRKLLQNKNKGESKMEKIKRIMAAMLACILLLPAVTALAGETEAAQELGKYGIMQGDPDGNLRLGDSISRAEFAKMIMAAKKPGSYAPTSTQFTDVTEAHWASGYIAACVEDKILNGLGDGTFAPNAPVTHEQAVKMVVCALGYGAVAEQLGGYPGGYFSVAMKHNLLTGVRQGAQPATRGEIAVLLAAALDVPNAETDTSYYFDDRGRLSKNDITVVFDGSDGNPLRTFRTELEKSREE